MKLVQHKDLKEWIGPTLRPKKEGGNMEDENQEVTNNEPNQQQETNQETKFTQQQFNEALRKEVERKTKGMPSKEEFEEFKKWKEKQQTSELEDTSDNNQEQTVENEPVDLEKQNVINENKVLKSGVNPEFSEFVTFQVSKIEGDFSKNLTKFLKDNPKYLSSEDNTKFVKKVGSSLNLEGSKPTQSTNQKMNDLIRSARD